MGFVGMLASTACSQSFRKLDNYVFGSSTMPSWVTQISDNGRFASGGTPAGNNWAIQWDTSTPSAVWGSATSSLGGSASAMSSDGSVMVGKSSATGTTRAVRWDANGLTTLPLVAGALWGQAEDVSADGGITVGYHHMGGITQNVFRYTQGTGLMENLGVGDMSSSSTVRCSGDGAVISDGNRYWTAGGGWQTLPGLQSYAYEVSDNGQFIVGSSKFLGGGPRGLLYDRVGGTMTDLGTLGFASDMFACSFDASVVVGASTDSSSGKAVWWRPGVGLRDLNSDFAAIIPTGWHLYAAHDVSGDGRFIAGRALNEHGGYQSWVIDVVPEPTSSCAAAIALAGYSGRRRTGRIRMRRVS